jgi:hypothetical protein
LQTPVRVLESAEQLHVTPLLVLMMKRPGLAVYKAAVTTAKKVVVPICTRVPVLRRWNDEYQGIRFNGGQ